MSSITQTLCSGILIMSDNLRLTVLRFTSKLTVTAPGLASRVPVSDPDNSCIRGQNDEHTDL